GPGAGRRAARAVGHRRATGRRRRGEDHLRPGPVRLLPLTPHSGGGGCEGSGAAGMIAAVTRFLDLGARPEDDPDLRVRKRATVGTIAATIVAALTYLILGIVADRPGIYSFAGAPLPLYLGLLIYLRRSGRLNPVVLVVLAAGLVVIASGVVAFGGLPQAHGNVARAVRVAVGG